jgi:hypothetical protein
MLMLSFEITPDGGVRIEGTAYELATLAQWLTAAVTHGKVEPTYIADEGVTTVEIICTEQEVTE